MDTETQAAALAAHQVIHAFQQIGGQCEKVERHIEQPTQKFLHLEAMVNFSRMRFPVDTAILRDCPELEHWRLLTKQLRLLIEQFEVTP